MFYVLLYHGLHMPPENLKKSNKIFRVLWGMAPRDPKVDSLEDECGLLSSGLFLMVPKEALCKFSYS